MFSKRVVVYGALAAGLVACAPLDEPAPTATQADGATLGDDVTVETVVQTDTSVTNLTLAEFVGTVDEAGNLAIEMLPVEEWVSEPADGLIFGLRDVEQANWCEVRVTAGRPDTVTLTTVGGSIAFTPAGCGLPSTFPYNTLGSFCFDGELRNNYARQLGDVYAEITRVSPDTGYNGYTYSATSGNIGADPSGLTGVNAPTDTAGGLFGYGDIAGGASNTVQWVFENDNGAFSFSGRILGVLAESCNGIDDDCDGEVDEEAGCALETEACTSDLDCATGNCDVTTDPLNPVCGPSLCGDLTQNGSETDVDCGGACDPCATPLMCLVDEDCASDICLSGTCADYDVPSPGELVITEFFANPNGDESLREYVEVYNTTGAGLNLNGCSIEGDSTSYIWTTDAIVPAGYGVLARGGAPTADDAPAGDVTYNSFTLPNSGGTIRLVCNAQTIDELVYTEAQNAGVSTQLDASLLNALANDDAANLCATPTATFGPLAVLGTPGGANEACPSYELLAGDYCTIDLAAAVEAADGGALRMQASLSIAGLTDGTDDVDTNPTVSVQLGYGPTGFAETDPAWTWTDGAPVNDWYDTYGVDGYEALVTMPAAGTYVVAARVSTDNGATFTYCDRRLGVGQVGSEDGFNLADATQLTVDAGAPAPSAAGDVIFTELMPNAVNPGSEVAEFIELHNPGATEFDLAGCIIADNNRPSNDHVIEGSVRVAPGEYIVITHTGSFDENYGIAGDYTIDGEFNLSNGGDSVVIECGGTTIDEVVWDAEPNFDLEGVSNQLMPTRTDETSNDTLNFWCYTPAANAYGDGTQTGTPGAANPACATIDACRLQAPTTISSGVPNSNVSISARVQSVGLSDLTTGTDANAALTLEIGWGADGTDPSTGWTWYAMAADGTWDDSPEAGFDQYVGDLTLPATGLFNFDYAVRISADAGLNYVFCDTTDGDVTYTAADAGQGDTAETFDVSADTCQVDGVVEGFAGLDVDASVVLTSAQALGSPSSASVVAEIGYAPAGGDASLDLGDFVYTGVSYASDAAGQWTFTGPVTLPTAFNGNAGFYELAARVSGDGGANWIYCDSNGGSYAAADNGALVVDTATATNRIFNVGTSQSATEFTTVNLGMQWADSGTPSLTRVSTGVDASTDVVIECGWAADGVDPVTNPNNWNWFAASPIAAWSATYFDGWECDLTVPASGTYDTAFRISTDAGSTFTYVDTTGAAVFATAGDLTATADPNAPCLLFSEYVEGSSSNKGVEIHNCGTADVNLADIHLCWENNSNTTCDTAVALGTSGVLAAGDVITACTTAWALAPACDVQFAFPAPVYFNGDDRVGLFRDINGDGEFGAGEPLYDFILESGFNDPSDPGENVTWRRRADACTSFDGQSAFTPTDFYDAFASNNVDDFGSFSGCINAQFIELLDGDNGGISAAGQVTVVADGLDVVANPGASNLFPPYFDCSASGDLEVTLNISATDCGPDADVVVYRLGSAPPHAAPFTPPVVGNMTFTVPSTGGDADVGISVRFISSPATCTVSIDEIYASCPAGVPALTAGDVLINEVSLDGPTQWFELVNTTAGTVDLAGLQVDVDGQRFTVIDNIYDAPAGHFLVVDENFIVGSGAGSYYFDNFPGFSLTNASTMTVLAGTTVIDSVTFDGGVNFPSGAAASINLDPGTDAAGNDAASSWCDATTQTWNGGSNIGSPGASNDACPSLGNTPTTNGQLVITEFQPLGAADYEFVEIYNPTGSDLDLSGCTFGDNSTAPMDVAIGMDGSGDTVVEAGTYFVFGATADAVTDGAGISLVDYEYGAAFGLSGSGDHLEVECGGTTIAAIDYNGTEYGYDAATIAISSQLDPRYLNDAASQDGSFWCASVSGSYNATPGGVEVRTGTPGAANENCGSVTAPAAPPADALFVSELMGSPDNSALEWIELYNPTSTTYDLSGLYHIDIVTKPDTSYGLFPAGSLIGPGEFFVFADDAAAVVDAEGTSLVDAVISNLEGINGGGDDVFLCTANNDACATALVSFTSNGFTSQQSNGLDPEWFNTALGAMETLSNWCDDATASYLNGDGAANTGTPGAANTDCGGVTDPAYVDIVQQSFEPGATWGYGTEPAEYVAGPEFWGVDTTTAPYNSFTGASIPDGTNYIYGEDLNNLGMFITLNQVDVSAYSGVEVTFWFYSFGYDSSDNAYYQVVVDGAAFDTENSGTLLDKSSGAWTQVTVPVPAGAQTVALQVYLDQNGGSDNIAFDDFRVRGVLTGSSAFTPGTIAVTVGSPTFDSNTYNDVVQVANAEAGATPGGVAVSANRTVYGLDSDSANEAPTYTGTDHPYVIIEVADTISSGAGVTANIGWVVEHGSGRRVLSIEGYPMYQFTGDAADTDAAGVGEFGFHAFAGDGTNVEEVVSGPAPMTLAEQSFEGTEANPWAFTPTPAAYNAGATDDAWGVAVSPYGGVAATDGTNVWGGVDNDNPTANGDHVLEFDAITVTGFTDVTLTFDYSADYNSSDRLDYEVSLDGGAFTSTNLVLGTDTGGFLTETALIPDGTNTVQLRLVLNQNGNGQYGLWDNIRLTGVASPQTVAEQSFEGTEASPWAFTPTPATYNAGATDDAWGVAASPYGGVTATDGANVWGGVDNDNPTAAGDHMLQFDSLDISGFDSVSITFDYSADYNASDRLDYEVSLDGGAYTSTNLVLGTDTGGFLTETIVVPDGTNSVQLRLLLNQNGNGQYGIWDNIVVTGTPNGMGAPAEVDACINNPCSGANVTCTDIVPSNDDTVAGRTCSCDIGGETYTEGVGCAAAGNSCPGGLGEADLMPGDVVVINYAGDSPDAVDVLFLELVAPGVVITVGQNGYIAATGLMRTGEGSSTITVPPGGYAPGTVVNVPMSGLSSSGDQVFLFAGAVEDPAELLFGINMNGDWDTGTASSSTTSQLPPQLTAGTTAIAIAPEIDNAAWDGGVTNGTIADYLSAIADPANWSNRNNSIPQSVAPGPFTVTDACTP